MRLNVAIWAALICSAPMAKGQEVTLPASMPGLEEYSLSKKTCNNENASLDFSFCAGLSYCELGPLEVIARAAFPEQPLRDWSKQ